MSILPLPIEDSIDDIIADLDLVLDTSQPLGPNTQTGREILVVRSAQLFTAGHVSNGTAGSQGYIRLLGSPSPSSEVTNGYIRFVAPDALRTPAYSPARKQINLWVDQSYLPMTLAQLAHAERYLWVGFFGAHTYGDLHSIQ